MALNDIDVDKQEETDEDVLMEQLRKNPKQVKTLDDITQLLHVIASEQKARNILCSCMDKVLINMSDIQCLRDTLDRLRSVARTNGLRFKLRLDKESVGPETCCIISGDMFDIEIVLDGNHFNTPVVLDVKVNHSDQVRSCPELIEIIRNGNFLDFSKHLKGLIDMYPTTMDRQTKTRVYMALQSLEADINKMNQLYLDSNKDSDSANIVLHGLVGLLAPRVTSRSCRLSYYLTPYDVLDTNSHDFTKIFDQLSEEKGLHAEVRIEMYPSPCKLPITPLIANNHPIAGSGQPRFTDVNQHNSIRLPACFVLKLKPPVIVMQSIADDIEEETGMSVFKDSNLQSYLSLLQSEDEVLEVIFGAQKHVYNLDLKHFKAGLVKEIHFTHPSHLVAILNLLRKQAYLNTIFSSCIRPKKAIDVYKKDSYNEWFIDVSVNNDLTVLNLTFEHPFCPNSSVFGEILFSSEGFLSCQLFTGRGDPSLCSDQYVTTILRKSFSLSIMMRNLVIQTKRNPRKEPDRNRVSRHPTFHQHPATTAPYKKQTSINQPKPALLNQGKPPNQTLVKQASQQNQLKPVNRATQPEPVNVSSVNPVNPSMKTPVTALSSQGVSKDQTSGDLIKKESQHPMLTQLLKPMEGSSTTPRTNNGVQKKSHPMLMGLLKENENGSKPSLQQPQQQGQVLPQRQQFQQIDMQMQQQAQYPQNNQMQNSYMQQQGQMPPPPSYSASQMKPSVQQQYQMQQQMQYSNPSPLNYDELPGPIPPPLTSPFSSQSSMSHSITPPLYPMVQSPLRSPSLPSPLYTSHPSPMQPPMNTPQSMPIASPMHSAMTPPIASPASRKMQVGRRASRQKSHSQDASGYDLPEIGFNSQFDMLPDNDGNQVMDMFNSGMSPAQSQNMLPQRMVSPSITQGNQIPLQQTFSNDRSINFSFDSDIGMDNELQRRNSYGRRHSNQPFMTPSPALSLNQDSQDAGFPTPSPINMAPNDGFPQNVYSMPDIKPSASDLVSSIAQSYSKASDMFLAQDSSVDVKPPVSRAFRGSQSEQPDTDPFNFDDNKNPLTISMPDSSGSIASDQKNKSISRATSVSSNQGSGESTLKVLLSSTSSTGGESSYIGNEVSVKSEKLSNIQMAKANSLASQRRGSQENASGMRSADLSGPFGGHKPLVRQHAIGKGSQPMRNQSMQGDGKEKTKKRALKEETPKAPPKRRGRPPSTEKREHAVKRKKTEAAADDSEAREKIVLKFQMDRGMPISSSIKKEKLPPSESNADKNQPTSSAGFSAIGGSSSSLDAQYSSELQQYLNYQGEQEKKKKEKKMGTGSSNPALGSNKNNSKGAIQTASGLTNASGFRGQLGSGKVSAAGGNKSSLSAHQKGSQVSQQNKGVPSKPRKSSITEVTDKLRLEGGGKSGQLLTGNPYRKVTGGIATAKAVDRLPGSDQAALLKLPNMGMQGNKLLSGQSPKVIGGKASMDDRLVAKGPLSTKQGPYNKAQTHSSKPGGGSNRSNSVVKKDKPRSAVPQRDGKGNLFSAQISSNNSKASEGNPKLQDMAAANPLGKQSLASSSVEISKRLPQGRPPTNKSPRSVTPPQNRHPSFGGPSQFKPEGNLQALLKSKKPPTHPSDSVIPRPPSASSLESNDDNSSNGSSKSVRASPVLGRRSTPTFISQAFLPPPPKKHATETSESKGPTTSKERPQSPDDRLIIDDGSTPSKQPRVQTPTPASSAPPAPAFTQQAPSLVTPYVSLTSMNTDFMASPKVGEPPSETEDALMDMAVSGDKL